MALLCEFFGFSVVGTNTCEVSSIFCNSERILLWTQLLHGLNPYTSDREEMIFGLRLQCRMSNILE
jgi:hypothetical protein